MQKKILQSFLLISFVSCLIYACSESDETPPVLQLNGSSSVRTPLNEPWEDPGAKATDDYDGNITSKVFVNSSVDVNRAGFYEVRYSVVDQAGNMAGPISRMVEVYNESEIYKGNYEAIDHAIFPTQDSTFYTTQVIADSSVNNRLFFSGFAFADSKFIFGDVKDTVVVLPFQYIENEGSGFTVQGSGRINDTLILIQYTKIDNQATYLSEVRLQKQF